METQQATYITPQVQQTMKIFAQHWVKEQISGGNRCGILSCEVRFSERHRQRMVDDMIAVRQDRDDKFLKRLAAKESKVEATKDRWVHNDIRHACLGLLIKVAQKVLVMYVKLELLPNFKFTEKWNGQNSWC